ncbi:hypothetical protein K1X76_06525 [bacterium]|nr:hypothetical protein [bacterium]
MKTNKMFMIALTVLGLTIGVSSPILAEDNANADSSNTGDTNAGSTGSGSGDTTTEQDPHGQDTSGGAGMAGDGPFKTTRTCSTGVVVSTCKNDSDGKRSVKLFGGAIDIAIDLYEPYNPDEEDMTPEEKKILKKYGPVLKAMQQELQAIHE